MIEEEWRKIAIAPDYSVSNTGRVRRDCGYHWRPGRYLKGRPLPRGYLRVYLHADGKAIDSLVHRLVARAFIGESDKAINHIDGNKENNAATNLEYCTNKENTAHAIKIGTYPLGERNYNSKLDRWKVQLIREAHRMGVPCKDVARKWGICEGNVYAIWKRKTWKHIP